MFQGPRVVSPKSQGLSSRFTGDRVPCPGSQGPRSQVLILDYVLDYPCFFLYIQDLISAGDNVCFISNKRCLRSSKKLHKMGLKKYLMNRSIPFFSNIFGMTADVSLVREAILFLSKLEAGCFQSKYK